MTDVATSPNDPGEMLWCNGFHVGSVLIDPADGAGATHQKAVIPMENATYTKETLFWDVGVLANKGLKYNATEIECGDGATYVDFDIWSGLDDAPVDASSLQLAAMLLTSGAEAVAGGKDQKRVTAVHLSIRVQAA